MRRVEISAVRAFAGAFVLVACLAAAPVHAHGGMKHVMGTVKEVGSDHLVVETRQGKSETVAVDDHTTYERQGEKAPPTELKVGDRVVVHLEKSAGDKVVAKLVRFSEPRVVQNPTTPNTMQREMQGAAPATSGR